MPDPSSLGERLRQARRIKGLSQAQLAGISGLSAAALSHMENGRRSPSVRNLVRVADALGISVDTLLGREPEGRTLHDPALVMRHEAIGRLSVEALLLLDGYIARVAELDRLGQFPKA